MSTRTTSLRLSDPTRFLAAAFAIAALAVIGCARGTAAAHREAITVVVPTLKTVGSDSLTGTPIEKSTVTARVAFDPLTLTTESGVARLRERVLEAASRTCRAALTEDYEKCVLETVRSAEPQVDQAIARSRDSSAS
jgi:UrcA family protein